MTNTNHAEQYEKHDVNGSQANVLELIRKIERPVNGNRLVETLLKNRYLWFSVFPICLSNAVAPMEISQDSFYADGLCIYTDASGSQKLVTLLQGFKGVEHVSFINLSQTKFDGDDNPIDNAPIAAESTVFVNVSWEIPEELEQKFARSVI